MPDPLPVLSKEDHEEIMQATGLLFVQVLRVWMANENLHSV